ncbi:MFS transporter, sugar porter (SP) family [Flavobacterium glycines]|uniref:MFS transporter n=1 Tax=Flavobacterium glycines TaxID=551990 RepID=A0A1B9DZ96_9FLAO|nr:sugar porter family MFS transporter [Flavobacterium glycines]OCB75011.1 MFS transporter [Flavobacterium glycines]GEL11305.1 MFS transporter [Flavobacterium glycines]SDJ42512.1 MFS transporter, sugar porter (SP) family [Flavobacterium glycines]
MTSQKKQFNNNYLLAISMVSALGGLLFGYDWVVIGGAKPFYERFFDITTSANLQAWAMSSALIGCILGAVVSGVISDKFGRKWPLLLSAFLFTVASLGTGLASAYWIFVVFRIVGGVGIGLASALSPMYIAEVAPSHLRGRFVALNQMTLVVGILAAQIVNLLIADKVPAGVSDAFIRSSWNGQMGWRWMFFACAVPSVVFFLLVFTLPESPRWLMKAGKADKAFPTLQKIGGEVYAHEEMANIKATLDDVTEKIDFKALFNPKFKDVLVIGIVIAVFQQWCGINTVFNYAEEIFTAAGYGVSDTLFNIVITGTVNLIFTLVAMFTVDKWGRKKLMVFGALGLTITYLLLGSAFYFDLKGVAVLSLVVIAIAVYAMSLAPITWVILSEIFPNRVRGAAMALATFALWVACFILTYTFPLLNKTLGAAGTFWVYAGICVLGFLFVLIRLPETKGKTLEEIENELVK